MAPLPVFPMPSCSCAKDLTDVGICSIDSTHHDCCFDDEGIEGVAACIDHHFIQVVDKMDRQNTSNSRDSVDILQGKALQGKDHGAHSLAPSSCSLDAHRDDINSELARKAEDVSARYDAGAKRICAALHITTVSSIDLSGICFGDDSAEEIGASLEKNTSLTSIELCNNNITGAGAAFIGAALERNTTVTQISLSRNSLGPEGAKRIAAALKRNTSITSLDLAWNFISADGAKSIGEALAENSSLSSINLSGNSIRTGADCIGAALRRNSTLTSINLGANRISDDGAELIAAALESNTTLSSITLSKNFIGVKGADRIGSALQRNSSVTSLNLSNNDLGADGVGRLVAALALNTTLISLSLCGNFMGDEGVEHIGAMLEQNTALTSIDLSVNRINNNAERLCAALKRNMTITSIDLCGNPIMDLILERIQVALAKNKIGLRVLTVRHSYLSPISISFICTSIGGDHVADVVLTSTQRLKHLSEAIAEETRFNGHLRFLLPDSTLLEDSSDEYIELGYLFKT